jgi:hypothetical protein
MNDFENLDLNDRARHVWENGTFTENIFYYNFNIRLYTMSDGKYAEVWYSPVENEIVEITLLTVDHVDFQKWLNRIKLSF